MGSKTVRNKYVFNKNAWFSRHFYLDSKMHVQRVVITNMYTCTVQK